MSAPTNADLLAELCRVRAENARLRRLVTTQRPELKPLREMECALRDYLGGPVSRLRDVHRALVALLPRADDDLPTLDEVRGILSDGKDRVDAAMKDGHT